MVVEVIDNFLSDSEHTAMAMYCHNAPYQYGEVDHPGVRPTGMTHHIDDNSAVFKLLEHKTMPLMSEYPKAYIYRMYVNCFAPNEHPNFHIDNQDDNTPAITMLYYPNKKWKPDDGGETQLYIDHEIRGLVPRPNRLVYFDANILHRATTFRNRHRFTIAIKYSLE